MATAETEINILTKRMMNVPRRALRAFEKKAERKKLSEMAVLIQIRRVMITGPALIETISILKPLATRRKTRVETIAESRKSR